MYLFDTNIFLEIMWSQGKSGDCKKALIDHINFVFISDFSLHSIGVIFSGTRKKKYLTILLRMFSQELTLSH